MASSSEIETLERRWSENQLGLTFAPLAEAYRKAGDTARALELLQTGMAQHPNYVPALIVRGRCHLDGQADAEAELAFLRVTELDPENVIALKSLAEISERAGRLPEAMRRLESLIYIDRNNEEARGQLDRVREVAAGMQAAPVAAPPAEPIAAMAEVEDEPIELIDRHGSDDLVPPPASLASEFQLPSDAETLVPSDDRLEEVELLGEVPEFDLPAMQSETETAAAGDFSGSTEFELSAPAEVPEPTPPEPVEEPVSAVAPSEPDLPGTWETAAMEAAPPVEPAPAVLEMPVPIVDVQPPPPPPPAVEDEVFEPVAEEPVAEPPVVEEPMAEEPVAEEPVAAESEPELVVTETMAEIFLRQGHRELALAVYAQLAQRDPENGRVAEAYAALQAELAPPPPPAPEVPPAPQYAASATGGTSVEEMFQGLLQASRPALAPGLHPPAFEAPRRPTGEPTRPAQDTLSLSAVFGDEAAPSRPAGTPPGPVSGEPTFDEFFTPGDGANAELPKSAPPGATAPSQVPEDLEQFNAWLRGLKR